MALVEQVNSMKENGMSDVQVMNALKEQGFSPMEINEAISQSKIKAAVSEETQEYQTEEPGMEGMQSSMMNVESSPEYISTPSQRQPPGYQEQYAAAEPSAMPAAQEQPQAAQEQYYQQAPDQAQYAEAQAGYYSQGVDLETVRDISKRSVEEALKKIKEELASLSKLKTELKFEVQDIQNRLTKLESSVEHIQDSAIKKIANYGDSISALSKEIKATQDSFAKVINPLVNKARAEGYKPKIELPSISKAQTKEKPKKEKKPGSEDEKSKQTSRQQEESSSGASFEDYFR